MQIKKYFLPIGLLLATIMSFTIPAIGKTVHSWNIIPYLIITVFIANGFQTQFKLTDLNKRLGKSFIVMVIINLFLAPFLGMAIAKILNLPAALALGLLVISAMPTTLSSGIVISSVAKGSAIWALLYTMGLNLLGIGTIPIVLPLTLNSGGNIHVSHSHLLFKLITIVLIPFILGMLLRRLLKIQKNINWVSFIPPTCVITIVWMSLSKSYELLINLPKHLLIFAVIGSLLIHCTLLILNYLMSKPLQLTSFETRSFVIVGSQKTLPIAISVLSSLSIPIGQALIVCLIYHFSQLLTDSFIAGKWASIKS